MLTQQVSIASRSTRLFILGHPIDPKAGHLSKRRLLIYNPTAKLVT